MVKILLDTTRSLEENASVYYDKAKQFKKKSQGALEALEETKKKREKVQKEVLKEEKKSIPKVERKKEWYEKFRWFYTSEGLLVILGRDATSNEIVIKKHTNDGDLVFHTDIAGSPFGVIVSEGKEIGTESIDQAAIATGSYSRAWRLGVSTIDVFYVKPEQVTKNARAGEYLQKGSFMIHGKTTYLHPKLSLAIGKTKDERIIGGPVQAVSAHTSSFVEIVQGDDPQSQLAKKISNKLQAHVDDIQPFLPTGGGKLVS